MKIVIYPNGTGISVINPVLDCSLTIEQIAVKDTPFGVPYRIVDATEYPTDRSQRHLWTADFSNRDGYGGAK